LKVAALGSTSRLALILWSAAAIVAAAAAPVRADDAVYRPDVLIVTVVTLRSDHLSGYGYERNTSPTIDRLMADGVRFTEARTVVPLTCPALATMLTSLEPHVHGSTRNGIPIPKGLSSFPKVFAEAGYETAALVGNWALQDSMCGLAEHFQSWQEILDRRPFAVAKREADATDLTDAALEWLREFGRRSERPPLLLWVHYMDPHSPYMLNRKFLDQVGYSGAAAFFSSTKRYDTEIAHVDHQIGRLLEGAARVLDLDNTITLFTSDHGESLGEHGGYWGHGKHVYENVLRIPLSITWPAVLEPGTIDASTLITDVAATLLALSGVPGGDAFAGIDWSPVLRGEKAEPGGRVTFFQGHRGAVDPVEDPTDLRRKGLLEVGRLEGRRKEIIVVNEGTRHVFDVIDDPGEIRSLVAPDSAPSAELVEWFETIQEWLARAADEPPPEISDEDAERLRALGYIE
jgi:arylsulfatase A-like enzyme